MAAPIDKSMSFLIVDDQFNVRRMIVNFLRAFDYQNFVDASDGERAWHKLQNNNIDFIICDFNMPNWSGLDLLKRVRNHPDYRNIPFLMVTAEVMEDLVAQSIEEGVDDYLTKPFQADTLMGKIRNILDRRHNPRPIDLALQEGRKNLDSGNYDSALDYFKQAVDIAPDSPRAQLALAEALEKAGRDDDALMHYKQAVSISKRFVKAHDKIAEFYLKRGDHASASIHMEAAAKISPRNIERQMALGKSLLSLGKPEQAKAALDKALAYSGDHPKLSTEVGEIYLAANLNQEAADAFLSAVDKDPSMVHVYNRLGIAYRRQKKHPDAIKQYERAILVSPKDENLYYNIAVAFAEMGKYKSSASYLEKALHIKPGFNEAKSLLAKLNSRK